MPDSQGDTSQDTSRSERRAHMPLDGSLKAMVDRLLEAHPGCCTVGQAAKILKVDSRSVRRYHDKYLNTFVVEGMILYHIEEVKQYARTRLKHGKASHLVLRGIDVERMQKICEVYYRTQYDVGEKQLLALAKKVAKL